MPFGGGQTKCLGEQFATAEAVLAPASILTRWRPNLHDPRAALKPDTRIVLLPRRLPVRLTAADPVTHAERVRDGRRTSTVRLTREADPDRGKEDGPRSATVMLGGTEQCS